MSGLRSAPIRPPERMPGEDLSGANARPAALRRRKARQPGGRLGTRALVFLRRHLAGELPLAVSFWINLLALSTLYYGLQPVALQPLDDEPFLFVASTIAFLALITFVIFPWQAIGLLRCADNHYRRNQDPVLLRTVQGIVLVAGSLVLVHLLESAQALVGYGNQLEARRVEASGVPYSVAISADGRLLEITGTLDHGVTQAARDLLETRPGVTGVVLSSPGGLIYEGRGLANLINERSLAAYVFEECSSACATAFLGGMTRHLGTQARLGFHKYRLDDANLRPFARFYDLESEQNKDLSFYERQGISSRFRQLIFAQSPQTVWFPRHDELLDNGVVHTLATLPTAPSD